MASRSGQLAPVLLRVALGVTFAWAGLGKLVGTTTVSPQDAAMLSVMGVNVGGKDQPAPDPVPTVTQPERLPVKSPPKPEAKPQEPKPDRTKVPTPIQAPRGPAPREPLGQLDSVAGRVVLAGFQTQPQAADNQVRSVYRLAIVVRKAAYPAERADGRNAMRLWPRTIGSGSWPVYLAWAVALSEFIGGMMLLLGLLTRLAAASMVGVMLGAVWLTQVGPAVQSGSALLGFLPNHAAFDVAAWQPLLWQLSLLLSAGALMLLGSGGAAIDNLLFGGGPAPKPKAPAA